MSIEPSSDEMRNRKSRQPRSTHKSVLRRKILGGKVIEARKAGMTYSEIERRLGINANQARRLAKQVTEDMLPHEDAEEYRMMQLQRYESLYETRYNRAKAGDDDAYNLVIKTLASIDKLLGLPIQNREAKGGDLNVQIDVVEAARNAIEQFKLDKDTGIIDTKETEISDIYETDSTLAKILESSKAKTAEDAEDQDEDSVDIADRGAIETNAVDKVDIDE